jgi:hypothetical protein
VDENTTRLIRIGLLSLFSAKAQTEVDGSFLGSPSRRCRLQSEQRCRFDGTDHSQPCLRLDQAFWFEANRSTCQA